MRIKVPATSANLAVGFDCLGVALSIYNEFGFEQSNKYKLQNFEVPEEYNLVLKSYKEYFNFFEIEEIPVVISQIVNDIPVSRGLGSSASCIIAGVLAANELSQKLPLEECVDLMVQIEGHPDNIYPAVFGGMVSVLKDELTYAKQFQVHESLRFYVNIPDSITSTEESRNALSQKVSLQDAVYNVSRALQLDFALTTGELEYLKAVLKDKLHQDARAQFIPGFDEVKEAVEEEGDILVVSGSGSTVLIITDQEKEYSFDGFITKEVTITGGADICE